MKSKYIFLIAFLIYQLVNPEQLMAIAYGSGGELRYEYINDSTYRFFFKFSRTCSGIPEPDEVSLCYRNTTCGGVWYTARIHKMLSTPLGGKNGQPIDVGCPSQGNTCTNPSSAFEMYRDWWYSGVVVLPQKCNNWIFSVNISERDRTTLTNLGIRPSWDHNLYIEATLDNLNAPKQSSPYFTAPMPVYTCSGAPFHYNNGAVDPNGDSIVYKLIQPRSATTDITVVCAGYPPQLMAFAGLQYNLINNPLECNNTFNLNPKTGDISFTPSGNQVAYLAYLVEKYRNGKLIGSIMRDSRLEVNTCTSATPQVKADKNSVTGGVMVGDTLVICGNTPVNFCFNVQAASGISVQDNSSVALAGSKVTYQNQGTTNITGCLSWRSKTADTGLRNFIVLVKDASCAAGYPITQAYSIPIYVRPAAVVLAKDTVICPGASTQLAAAGGTQFSWSALPGKGSSSFSCAQCSNTIVTPTDTTYYVVTSNLANGCRNKDTIRVAVDFSNSINATPDTIVLCNGGKYVELSSVASGPKPLQAASCGANSPHCSGIMDSIEIAEGSNNSNTPNFYNPNSASGTYFGPFYQYYRTQRFQIIYRKEDLQENGIRPASLQKIAFNYAPYSGANPIYRNVKISMRCTDKFEFVAPYQTEFEVGLTEVFTADSVVLHPGWNEFSFTRSYDYDTTKNLVMQFCYSGVNSVSSSTTAGMLPIYYISTSYKSAIGAGQTAAGDACAGNLGTVITYDRRPDTRFTFCELPEADFVYAWTPSKGMDDAAAANTGVITKQTTWYTVSTKGRNGCVVKDSMLVYVANNKFDVNPKDTSVCEGEMVQLEGIGGYSYHWYDKDYLQPVGFSCIDCTKPDIVAPVGTNDYHVAIADYFGCGDTLNASIRVRPLPHTNIINNDTIIRYQTTLQLFAEGADDYLWDQTGMLSDNKSASPIASPLSPTQYVVTGYREGCTNKDSVFVDIDIRGRIMVPDAFTPNGDGKNDLFRIYNLTFQKVNTFSIYNRWGEQVYNYKDAPAGWDGTYKGVPQPLGAYLYVVEVVYPDGMSQSFKGDVTLIR